MQFHVPKFYMFPSLFKLSLCIAISVNRTVVMPSCSHIMWTRSIKTTLCSSNKGHLAFAIFVDKEGAEQFTNIVTIDKRVRLLSVTRI